MTSEVVGRNEVGEMLPTLVVIVVVEPLDGRNSIVQFMRSTCPFIHG